MRLKIINNCIETYNVSSSEYYRREEREKGEGEGRKEEREGRKILCPNTPQSDTVKPAKMSPKIGFNSWKGSPVLVDPANVDWFKN